MDVLCLDLILFIFHKLDFKSKIRFLQINKYYLNNVQIIDFYNIPNRLRLLKSLIPQKLPEQFNTFKCLNLLTSLII